MIKYISWAGFIVCSAIVVMRFFILKEPFFNIIHGAAFIPIVLASLIGIYKFDNYHIGRWGLLLYFLTVQPWHISRSGGLLSFGAIWLLVMIPYAAIFFSRKVYWLTVTWFSLILVYFAYNPVELDQVYFETPQLLARAFTSICAFFVLFIIIRTSIVEKERLRDEYEKLEKRKLLADTAISMAHEINNPLAIISLKAELLRRKGVELEHLEPLQESVNRIHNSVEGLKALSNQEELQFDKFFGEQSDTVQETSSIT